MPVALRALGWPLIAGILLALLLIQNFPHWVGLPADYSWFRVAPVKSYNDAVKLAAPAVANLYTSNAQDLPTAQDAGDPTSQEEHTLGSAVILRSDGYLLTNNHVIANANQIIVALHDGREVEAKLIGSDPETDLAVLHIPLNHLPTLELADSSRLKIGDIVLAIGNPLGVGQTVTMGIISATGRHQLGLNTYEDFLQTDAAINQGNSGGALIDSQGRLVGINTAVLSGSSRGIGFSIPANLALEVMHKILEHGQVTRGWLGLEAQSLSPEQYQQIGANDLAGLSITAIYANGPAHQAGIKVGDIILSIDGQRARDGRQVMHHIARRQPNSVISVELWRDGELSLLPVTLGKRPENPLPSKP